VGLYLIINESLFFCRQARTNKTACFLGISVGEGIGDNVSGIAEAGDFQHYRLIELQMLTYIHQPDRIV
jgi:hypothetical protein